VCYEEEQKTTNLDRAQKATTKKPLLRVYFPPIRVFLQQSNKKATYKF